MPDDHEPSSPGSSTDDIDVEHRDGVAVVRPLGELDLTKAAALRRRLTELISECPLVIVDLDALDYMDSSGLGALMAAYRFAGDRGHRFAIVCNQRRFRASFEVRGLDAAVPMYGSVDHVVTDRPDAPT